jgi:hypothetical protein
MRWIRIIKNYAALCVRWYSRPSAEEREVDARQPISDDEFIRTFYSDGTVPRDTIVRLRKALHDALCDNGKLRPQDNLAIIFDDVDFADVLYLVGRRFGLAIPKEHYSRFDGTVDSIVRYLVDRQH